jgi:hypothetical protein
MASSTTHAQLAARSRQKPDGDYTELRRRLKAEVLEERVRKAVDSAPALTLAQRAKLAVILLTGGDDADP